MNENFGLDTADCQPSSAAHPAPIPSIFATMSAGFDIVVPAVPTENFQVTGESPRCLFARGKALTGLRWRDPPGAGCQAPTARCSLW